MEYYLIFDLIVIVFILLSSFFAFSRGFSQEILSLISWGLAFLVSLYFSKFFIVYVNYLVSSFLLSQIITYCLVFVSSLFILSFITSKFANSVKKSSVGTLDRSLGFLFGILRGYILLCLCLFAFNSFYYKQIPKWLDDSKMNYLLMFGATKIVYFFDKNNYSARLIEDKIKKKSEKLFEKSIDSHLRRENSLPLKEPGYKKSERDTLNNLIENSNDY